VYAAAIVTSRLTLGPALLGALLLLPLLLLLTTRLSYTRSASSDAPTASSHGLCLQQQRQQRQTDMLQLQHPATQASAAHFCVLVDHHAHE
jgi:hypothetical protein